MAEERRPGRRGTAWGLHRVLGWLLALAAAVLPAGAQPAKGSDTAPATEKGSKVFEQRRLRMVERDIAGATDGRRGIRDEAVLRAMRTVPREEFVHPDQGHLAYNDYPLPIGYEQTISQPYIVAFMTEAARLEPGDRVLEVGTGSGYQAAVLAEIVEEVYTIEIVRPLGERATERLRALGYDNVQVRVGDGYAGWPEAAPFDAIMVTAAPDHVPPALVEQLKPGGRMVIPVGEAHEGQSLLVISKTESGAIVQEDVLGVRFVPMLGEADAEGGAAGAPNNRQ